jgi:hypothetical protein
MELFVDLIALFFRRLQKKKLSEEEDESTFPWQPFFEELSSNPCSEPSLPPIRNQLLLTIIQSFNS